MDTGDLSESIRDAIAREVKQAVTSSQNDLLAKITTVMDSKLSTFQTNIQQSQVELSETQICKMEETLSDNYTFQRKGNENQFKHQVKVLSKLKEAKSQLESPEFNLETLVNAKSRIEEGIDMIKERQKLIKLADSSELGWKVVNEYVSNPIADDSDDEKKMARAQARAEKKYKADKMKKNKNRAAPYSSHSEKKDDRPKFRSGRCFNCGKRGHWADECPDNKKSNKISTFDVLQEFSHLNSICSDTILDLRSDNQFVLFESSEDLCIHSSKHFKSHDSIHNSEHFKSHDSNRVLTPVNRLKVNIERWKLISSNEHVIQVIENGYKIPFKTEPVSVELKNNRSALDNTQFVSSEISNLLVKDCIAEISCKPMVINPLTVVKQVSLDWFWIVGTSTHICLNLDLSMKTLL